MGVSRTHPENLTPRPAIENGTEVSRALVTLSVRPIASIFEGHECGSMPGVPRSFGAVHSNPRIAC